MSLSTEQKVGLFFLAALLVLAVMIELVEDWRPFETQLDYHTYFQSAVGIKSGDPVRLAGVEVGRIRRIGLEQGRVRVDFYVTEGTELHRDTVASIRQLNLLGGQFLGLQFGTAASPPLPRGSAVNSVEGTNIDELITHLDRNQEKVFGTFGDLLEESRDSFSEVVTRLENISRKIDQGQGTLGRLVNDPHLYDELSSAVGDLKLVAGRLQRGEGTLGRLLQDETLYRQVSQLTTDLGDLSARLKAGQGTLGKLLVDDTLYQKTSDALGNIRDISAKANRGEGTLGRLVNDDALYEESRKAAGSLASVAAKIDEGRGTLGRLVNDDDMYRDAKTTLHKVEKAADGLNDSGTVSALGTVVGTLF